MENHQKPSANMVPNDSPKMNIQDYIKKLRADFVEYQRLVGEVKQREEMAQDDAKNLLIERESLDQQLRESLTQISTLNDKLRKLVQNYAELAHVIETKNKLVKEVEKLKSDINTTHQEHKDEIKKILEEKEEMKEQHDAKITQTVDEEQAKRKAAVEEVVNALNEKNRELENAKKENFKINETHKKQKAEICDKNHREQEKLRSQIAQLKQNRSSRTLSNHDLFTNKLQATRAEYEDQLRDRDSQISKMETELEEVKGQLKNTQEKLRHQELLNIVREVSTNTNPPQTPTLPTKSLPTQGMTALSISTNPPPTPTLSVSSTNPLPTATLSANPPPTPTPSMVTTSPAANNSSTVVNIDVDGDEGDDSEAMIVGSKNNDAHNRTQSVPIRRRKNASPAKLIGKRKLFTTKAKLIEDLGEQE